MATSSNKTRWLIYLVLTLVAVQLTIIGVVLARMFTPGPRPTAVLAQDGDRRSRRSSTPAEAPVKKAAPPKPKPTGPRAEPPTFSKTGGVFKEPVRVELSAKDKKATIRYTLDGREPSESSPAYTGPLAIQQNTLLRASCFQDGLWPSVAVTHTYTFPDSQAAEFKSTLPIVVIDMFGKPLGYSEYGPGSIRFIDAREKGTTLFDAPDYEGRTDIKRRGFSSLRFPKMSFTLKLRDDEGDKQKAELFGLPSDSDWVLYAPYVDKTLIRDVLGYELSNQMGRYAPRTRFAEVFLHRSGSKLTMRDYAGVYVLVEKIKRSKERVNIAKLSTNDIAAPDITGGYILKRDHGSHNQGRGGGGWGGQPRPPNNDGVGFTTPRGLRLFFVDPNEEDLAPEQRRYIARYVNEFERVLHSAQFADPENGYAKYLDVDAFIDHFWLVEATKNIDGFRYSAYLYKPRNGKLTMGPAWDWNLSFGNANYYDASETGGWYYENLRDTEISWVFRLRQDPNFQQRLTDRWAELRRDVFAPEKVLARVDELRNQLDAPQRRNFQRWPIMGRNINPNEYVGPTYDAEIDWMKNWIKGRITWIDRQFLRPPMASVNSGKVAAGTKVTLRADSGEIYYTLDGTDPRLSGGAKAESAKKFSDGIVVNGETKVFARTRRGEKWSAPLQITFTTR